MCCASPLRACHQPVAMPLVDRVESMCKVRDAWNMESSPYVHGPALSAFAFTVALEAGCRPYGRGANAAEQLGETRAHLLTRWY